MTAFRSIPDDDSRSRRIGSRGVSRVLVVSDDADLVSRLFGGLRPAGLSLVAVDSGSEAQVQCAATDVDVVILDLCLRDDGLLVLQALHESGSTMPVVVLTTDEHPDAVTCLDRGADDVLTRPFDVDELLARVRARLRGTDRAPWRESAAAGIRLDLRTREVHAGDEATALTVREFALLRAFVEQADDVLTRDDLMEKVWGLGPTSGSGLVDVYVSALRRKLGWDVIETVRGVGYRLRRSAALTAVPETGQETLPRSG